MPQGPAARRGVTAALGQATATTPVVSASAGKAAVTGGVAIGGKGLSLGLGIGLGLWGPVILAGLSAVGAYALWQSYQKTKPLTEDDEEINEALGSR